MAVPKKQKYTIDVNPPAVGTKFLEYGFDRIEELMQLTDEKTKFLPRTILMEDIDQYSFNYVDEGNLKLILDGKHVPTFYLENDRWGEFSKTWKFTDNDNNVPTPYITVRRENKAPGTRIGDPRYRVAQARKFRYCDVPILDSGEVIYLRFKMPEPTNVDLFYEVSLFTKYREDVNEYDKQVLKNFASRQGFLWIKGNPIPILLESLEEAKSIENIDGDRFYVAKYHLKSQGFLQDENEFEIVKTLRKARISLIFED